MICALWNLSPVTLTLLATATVWVLVWAWSCYWQVVQVAKAIDQIPGPKVPSFFLGHLSLLWQGKSSTDWFQRKCFNANKQLTLLLQLSIEIFNTFIGITKIYQQENEGFMRLWMGPTQPVVVIFDAECAEVGSHFLFPKCK